MCLTRTSAICKNLLIAIAIANPVLYLVSIGLGVGAYIDKNTGGMGVDGVSYITFLAPALLATAAIQGAIDESVYPTLEGFKWNKTFFSMNATKATFGGVPMMVDMPPILLAYATTSINANEKRTLYWSKVGNSLLVVVPFFSGRFGLNSDALLQAFGSRIANLQADIMRA